MTGRRDVALAVTDTSWMSQAACARSRVDMFPTDEVGVDHAIAVCAQCRCREACLEFALTNRIDHGIWGGESERGRRRILRERRQGAA